MELKIPGSQLTKVTNSHDVLSGEAMVSGDVVTVGGGIAVDGGLSLYVLLVPSRNLTLSWFPFWEMSG